MGQGGHSPDCDEAEVCKSQRGPESGTDKDRLIVGSRFWSPPLRNKPLALRVLFSCNLPFSSSASHQHTFTLSYKYQFTHNLGLCATDRPGGFESLELLQERSELLLRRRRQVPHSCLFPERCTLRELAAANQLQKVLVLQLLVQGCRSQLLLLLQPLLIHVPLWEVRARL